MYDAIIVGARCAGAPLGMLLAHAGHRVLVVDRASFPSDTMSTHFIQSPGMARLVRWGLIDDVFATNCPPIGKARFDLAGDTVELEIPLHAGITGLASPRRYLLDKILTDAAIASGAELAQGVSVDSLMYEGDRVSGVRGHTSQGDFEQRGSVVIGADGRNSVVARETGAPFTHFEDGVSAGYYTYYRGVECDGVETFLHDGLFCVMFPTNDGLTTVGLEWPRDRFTQIRRDVDGSFLAALDRLGEVGQRVRAGERVERFVGVAELPSYIRKAFGPGWALVGDACYHKDPAPADGITDAFRGAELLADAVDDILSGRSDEETALARYEQRHDEFARPLLDAAVRVARFDLTPQQRFDAFIELRIHNEEEVMQLLESNRAT